MLALLAGLVATAAVIAALPALLSTAPMRPLLERMLASRFSFGVAIESASLSWSGPQSFAGCAIASAEGFGGEPLFGARRMVLDASFASLWSAALPRAIELDGPALTVIRAPGGASNLDAWLERHPPRPDTTWPTLRIRGGTARVEDRRVESRVDADDIEVSFEPGRIALRARIAGDTEVGRLVVESATDAGGTRSCHIEAYGVDLTALDPLLRPWLEPGTRVAGRSAFEFTARRAPDGFVEFAGNGGVRQLAIPSAWLVALGVPLSLAPGPLSDPHLTFEGRVTLDPAQRAAEFERFAFRSAFFECAAHGSLGGAAAAPLTLETAVNFDLLARYGTPFIGSVLPFRDGTGYLECKARSNDGGGYHVVARGDRATFTLVDGPHFDWPATAVEADVELDAVGGGIRVRDVRVDMRGGALTGGVDWRAADDFDATLRWIGDWEPVEGFIAQWEFGTFWDGGGEFDATATWSRKATRTKLGLRIAATDLALQFSPREGNFVFDDYFFRGTPFQATASAEFDPAASRTTWSGSIQVDAPGAIVRDDTFADLVIAARLDGGVVTLDRCEGRVHDGRFRAAGTITLRDGDDAAMQLRFDAEDLQLGGHASEWAGQICPVFATKGGPYRVTGTPRLTGSIAVTGTGYGLRSLARSARGEGRTTWSAGTLRGSDLLNRLAVDAAADTGIAIDGITTDVVIDNARTYARSVVQWPGRPELIIDGSADWAGNYDFRVDARSALPAALVERHRERLEGHAFALRGTSGRPLFDVPEVRQWLELDAKGALDAALRALPASAQR